MSPRMRRYPAGHLADLPAATRAALEQAAAPMAAEDGQLESGVSQALAAHPRTLRAVLRTLRAARLQARVAYLVPAVQQLDPSLSLLAVFDHVALHVGLSAAHVRDLYYRRQR